MVKNGMYCKEYWKRSSIGLRKGLRTGDNYLEHEQICFE